MQQSENVEWNDSLYISIYVSHISVYMCTINCHFSRPLHNKQQPFGKVQQNAVQQQIAWTSGGGSAIKKPLNISSVHISASKSYMFLIQLHKDIQDIAKDPKK